MDAMTTLWSLGQPKYAQAKQSCNDPCSGRKYRVYSHFNFTERVKLLIQTQDANPKIASVGTISPLSVASWLVCMME
jgi:hypothetical protein